MLIPVGILYGLTLILLLIVMAIRPERSSLSRFELERRAKAGQAKYRAELRRENLLHDVYSLLHALAAVFLVTISALGVLLFHWSLGFLIALLIALWSGVVARLKLIEKLAARVYQKVEPAVLDFIENHPRLFWLVRTVAPLSKENYIIESREELNELIHNTLPQALSDQEKQLISSALQFDSRTVKEIMTPRESIDTISKDEMLGPLVLDELYKSGHSRFPVIDKNVDHIVGILHIQSFLRLKRPLTVTAEKAMDDSVNFIRFDQTLAQALTAFLRTRHHLFIVINQEQQTVGILSLEDVIEALVGRKLYDEFEQDDRPAAVAERAL